MHFNCKNCASDQFNIVKGIYTCQYCGTTFRYSKEEGFVECDPKDVILMVSVHFYRGRQTYDYIYDLEDDIKVGDKVVVKSYNGTNTVVTVTDINLFYLDELPMPLNGYKKIIEKYMPYYTPEPEPVKGPSEGICGTPFINEEYKANPTPEYKPKPMVYKPSKKEEIWDTIGYLFWFLVYVGLPIYLMVKK